MDLSPVVLSDEEYVGKGTQRYCYQHPTQKTLCIKIPFNQEEVIKPLRREFDYYRRLARKKPDWRCLVRYLGEIETNLGHGAVYELVRDDDGPVSRNLEYYLENDGRLEPLFDDIKSGLVGLHQYLMNECIIPLTLYPKNMVLQQGQDTRVIIIDDIGNNDFLPFAEWSKRLTRKKIKRKWGRFLSALAKDAKGREALQKLVDELRIATLPNVN